MADEIVSRAADELVLHCRELAAAGLVVAAAGNASVRVGTQVLMTATGARFRDLSPDDLVLVDADGSHADGSVRPTSELALHLETYRRRPDAHAVMHTHGRHAVALSSVADTVPVLHYYALDLGGTVPVAPYRTFGTPELATVTTDALGEGGGVVMAHHGSLTVGADLGAASDRAVLLEWLCEVALLAMAAGPPREITTSDLEDVRRQIQARRPS